MVQETTRGHHGEFVQAPISPPTEHVGSGAVKVTVYDKVWGPYRGPTGLIRRLIGRRQATSGDRIIPESGEQYAEWLRSDEYPKPQLQVTRSLPGNTIVGGEHIEARSEEIFGGTAMQLLEQRDALREKRGAFDSIEVESLHKLNYDISLELQATKKKYGGLHPDHKHRVQTLMEAEDLSTIPDNITRSYRTGQYDNWCDWINGADDGELEAFIRWHDTLLRQPPSPEVTRKFEQLFNKYDQGLRRAVNERKLDPLLLQRFAEMKKLRLVVTSPLSLINLSHEGFYFPKSNVLAVAGAHYPNTDPEEIFSHEVTHALGDLLHDTGVDSAVTEATTEYLAQVIMKGEDKLVSYFKEEPSGPWPPLRRNMRKILRYAYKTTDELGIPSRDLSYFYARRDVRGFANQVTATTGYNLLGYLAETYRRRHAVRGQAGMSLAAEETETIMNAAIDYIITGKFDAAAEQLDKEWAHELKATIDAAQSAHLEHDRVKRRP